MPPQQAPPALNLQCPTRPQTPDRPVNLPANHPLVTKTGFLNWQPTPVAAGGGARVEIPFSRFAKGFLRRLRISRQPADVAAARQVSFLMLGFTEAALGRYAQQLLDSGLLQHTFADLADLHSKLDGLTLPERL